MGADYDQQQARADLALAIAETLQDLEEAGWTLDRIETRNGFDRYSIRFGLSFWSCTDCGSIKASPDDGCQACGYGTLSNEELAA
jgi:hypothetical protein